ncbi:MAG: aldo/keto reductase [Pedobacter sp.]|nr:aldo/keto reductase [Pedobacter sp.]
MHKLGLGCVTFGREIDQKTSFSLMDHAFANGINSFDTAAVYGGGASEEIIGKWLADDPSKCQQIKVATKIVPPFDSKSIISNVEQSLQRLQIEQIDRLYFHRWDDILDQEESWLAMEQLVADGKVKEIGASNFSGKQLLAAVQLLLYISPLRLGAVQNNHNLAVSDLSSELVQCCRQNHIKIITFSPLGAGFLTGKHRSGIQSGSRFDLMPAHQEIYFNEKSSQSLERLLTISASTGLEPAFLALAWAIHQPHTDQVLVGGRSTEQLDQAIHATRFSDMELISTLAEI